MPSKEKISTNVYSPSRAQNIYKGELPIAGRMSSPRMWNSDVGSPGVTNDIMDSAGLGQNFSVGDIWNDTVNDRLYKCEFTYLTGAAISGVSSILDIKLYRDDSAVTGDVLVKEFDIHYQSDAMGSTSESVK